MGMFNRFFNKNLFAPRIQLITDSGNGFYSWDGKLYKSDIIRSCIRPMAKAIGKLTPKHIRNNKKEGFKVNPEPYMRFLLEEPNPYMTGQMLLEKSVTQLKLNNNAFIYIHRDEFDYPVGLYPVPAIGVEAIYDKQGYLYLKCTLRNGKTVTYPYKDIIHLRQDYNENDVFGESPQSALKPLMEIINTTDQGIVKAIKNGSAIKWLLKFNQSLRPEDIKKQTKEFVDNFLSIDTEFGGAAAADSKYDAKQVDPKDYVPNATQTERTVQRLYSFFNTNEKIIQSKYNEDEWNAYYESEIEPVAIQLSNEFTIKLFTRKERGFGNKIVFESANLQYASMNTKMNLVQMVDRGAMTPNEWREILGLAPIKGGDEPIRRLDTAVVTGTNINESNSLKNNFKNKIVNTTNKTYAIDFDGTLCNDLYPKIGSPKDDVIDYVKNIKSEGNKLILWTCRTGSSLEEAKSWCNEKGIEFDAINESLEEDIEGYDDDSRKIVADIYLDDKALNVADILT